MKLRIITVCGLLICALALLGCGENEIIAGLPYGDLFSLKVGEYTDAPSIPTVITKARWDTGLPLTDDPFVTMAFNDEGPDYTEEVRISAVASPRARVDWGIGDVHTRPDDFFPTGMAATFSANDYIYIRVTSSDGYITQYYRFYARVFSPVRELASLTVAGRDAEVGSPANDPSDIPASGNGDIYITTPEANNAILVAETFDENATVLFALGTNNSTLETLAFQEMSTVTVTDRQWLYVKVTAQNGVSIYYYRFRINVGRMTSIKTLKFIGEPGANTPYDVVGKGFPGSTWTNSGAATTWVTPGAFDTSQQPSAGFKLDIELDDVRGKWEYAKVATTTAAEPTTWIPSTNTNPILFSSGEVLALRIIPERAGAAYGYYKVKVGLLAADFLVHPKAAKYNVGETAAELDFEMDRDIPGTATYQWYEANSWYGGYGFDADGNIFGVDTGFTADPTDPKGEPQYQYYVGKLDEKSNVSFHNGGNEFYRLPIPGRAITEERGGKSPKFRPPTDKRPFIAGFSNITHYYWVVVSFGGLTATSKRAVIVTEHNTVWDLGENTGESTNVDGVPKKHWIIDMPNLKDQAGNPVSMRNPAVFTSFRQPYKIDLRGAMAQVPNFDIYDYSVATAQALFFLRDGTPWIQNWTQGNISFIDINIGPTEDDPSIKVQDGDKEKIVLYYNLTNNNATLGLGGDGKEPSGGSLDKDFTHVVIMPSGEKPMKRMPPLSSDRRPMPNDDAQGWFCGFIELVELRFEGPPRPKPSED